MTKPSSRGLISVPTLNLAIAPQFDASQVASMELDQLRDYGCALDSGRLLSRLLGRTRNSPITCSHIVVFVANNNPASQTWFIIFSWSMAPLLLSASAFMRNGPTTEAPHVSYGQVQYRTITSMQNPLAGSRDSINGTVSPLRLRYHMHINIRPNRTS